MKKLVYLIVAIAVLGLIVPGCIPLVPPAPTEQSEPTSLTRNGTNYYVSDTIGNDAYTNAQAQNPATPWETISHAVTNVISGDTILVTAGEYTEQLLITKSLTLIGAGESTTIIKAPATRTGTVAEGSTWDYIVAAYPTTGTIDVKIEGFTVDADNQPKTTGTAGLIGVFFRDVSGTNAGLYSCTIQDFGTTEYESWSVRVYGDSDLTIDDNTLTGYTRDGIVVNGDNGGGAEPNVVISNNDLTGSSIPLNGIQIAYGATGTIIGNTVRDHTRPSPWAAVGILVKNSNEITISNNTVQNSHYGIHLEESNNCIVSANTLTANIAKHIGLLSSNNNQVSSNTITGTTAGTEDCAIRLNNGSDGNTIDGNTITMANIPETFVPRKFIYLIYLAGTVGTGSNTIEENELYGGTRAIQIDGGNTGTTTISGNTVGNLSPSFAGIYLNGGNAVISGNTLTNTVRPVEFWGALNVAISDNFIDGSTYDGINCGSTLGTITITGNKIYNLPDWQFAIHGHIGADNIVIDDNEMYNSHRGIGIEMGCTGVSITNNYIHDNGWSGIELHETAVSIMCNTLDHNKRGIETWAPITAHYNNILYHMYGGLILHDMGPHNAEYNWWGDASGPSVNYTNLPGTGTVIVTNGNPVDYDPWSFTPDPCEAKTLGFWKNHPDSVDAVINKIEAPVLGNTYEVNNVDDALEILNNAKAKNAYNMLAAQLLTAELNLLHLGHIYISNDCFVVPISVADGLLTGYDGVDSLTKPTNDEKEEVIECKETLDSVNIAGCVGACVCEWD